MGGDTSQVRRSELASVPRLEVVGRVDQVDRDVERVVAERELGRLRLDLQAELRADTETDTDASRVETVRSRPGAHHHGAETCRNGPRNAGAQRRTLSLKLSLSGSIKADAAATVPDSAPGANASVISMDAWRGGGRSGGNRALAGAVLRPRASVRGRALSALHRAQRCASRCGWCGWINQPVGRSIDRPAPEAARGARSVRRSGRGRRCAVQEPKGKVRVTERRRPALGRILFGPRRARSSGVRRFFCSRSWGRGGGRRTAAERAGHTNPK